MFNLRIDRRGYSFKPTGYEIAKISNRLSDKTERNTVVKLKEKEYCTLDEAVKELEDNLQKAINSTVNQSISSKLRRR